MISNRFHDRCRLRWWSNALHKYTGPSRVIWAEFMCFNSEISRAVPILRQKAMSTYPMRKCRIVHAGYRLRENLMFDKSKRDFLQAGIVSATVWIHKLDSNQPHDENLDENTENAACCLEQILEATLQISWSLRQFSTHLTNQPEKRMSCWALRVKSRIIHKRYSLTAKYIWMCSVSRLARTYICSVGTLDVV